MLTKRTVPNVQVPNVQHEEILLDFLFGQVGDGASTVTLSQVDKYCSRKATARQAYSFYSDFSRKVQSMVKARGYFETKKNELPRRIGLLLPFYILMMIGPMALASQVDKMFNSPLQIIAMGSVLGFLVFISFGPKKRNMFTQTGEDQYALWRAFKNFLIGSAMRSAVNISVRASRGSGGAFSSGGSDAGGGSGGSSGGVD